jgi:hypothetical protein
MTKKLLAFHGDHAIKDKYLDRLRAHALADEIVQGIYWQNGKGCAVGCTIHGFVHHDYETLLGIPESLARLEDQLFEGLPNAHAKTFPIQFLESIAPGADLSKVENLFLRWLLIDESDGVINYADFSTKQIIRNIAELHEQIIKGEKVSISAWNDAAFAARTAQLNASNAARQASANAMRCANHNAEANAESTVANAKRRASWLMSWSAESAAENAANTARSAARRISWDAARHAADAAHDAAWCKTWTAAWSIVRDESVIDHDAPWIAAFDAQSIAGSAAYEKQALKLKQLLTEA